MKKVGIYVRVSTDEQAKVEEGSIKNQIASLKNYIEGENLRNGVKKWGVLVGVFKDDGYSGKNLKRPEIKRLLKDISKKKIDTVLMTEISRGSRSVRDWIDLNDFFQEHGVGLVIQRQHFDTSTAMGRAMFNFAIEFSQLEREMNGERVSASIHERAKRGLFIGGSIPYGLDKTDRPGHLKINVAKGLIAEEIIDIFINKAGYINKALDMIADAGYTRDGGKAWTRSSLTSWIRSHALVGLVEVNTKSKDKEQNQLKETEKYSVVKAVWDPIISKEKWAQANDLITQNYQKLKVPKWKHHEYLLTGLLQCASGKVLVGGSGWGRKGKKYTHYKHQEKQVGKCDCGIPTVSAEKIETKVIGELKKLTKSPELISNLTEKANIEFKKGQPSLKKALASLNRTMDSFVKKLDNALDGVDDANNDAEKKMWLERSQRIQEEKCTLEKEIQELNKQSDNQKTAILKAKDIIKALNMFREGFDTLPIAAKRSFLNAILRRVTIQKDEIVLHIKDPGFLPKNQSVIPVNHGGNKLVYWKNWLPLVDQFRTDLIEMAACKYSANPIYFFLIN